MLLGLFSSFYWGLTQCRSGGGSSFSGLNITAYCCFWSIYIRISRGLFHSGHLIMNSAHYKYNGILYNLYSIANKCSALCYLVVGFLMYTSMKYILTLFLFSYFSWLSSPLQIAWQTMGSLLLCRTVAFVFKVVPHHSLYLFPLA